MPTNPFSTYAQNRVLPLMNPDDAMASMLVAAFAANLTLVAGTVVGKVTIGGLYVAYDHTAIDGSGVAAGILQYDVTTNATGEITNWGDWGTAVLTAPIYTQGQFAAGDLTGWDSDAAAGLPLVQVI